MEAVQWYTWRAKYLRTLVRTRVKKHRYLHLLKGYWRCTRAALVAFCHCYVVTVANCNTSPGLVCISHNIGFILRFRIQKTLTYSFSVVNSMLVWNFGCSQDKKWGAERLNNRRMDGRVQLQSVVILLYFFTFTCYTNLTCSLINPWSLYLFQIIRSKWENIVFHNIQCWLHIWTRGNQRFCTVKGTVYSPPYKAIGYMYCCHMRTYTLTFLIF